MIKFFRKIRKKILTENKFSKYLIKIVILIIGILIGLSINNWNEIKKIKKMEICQSNNDIRLKILKNFNILNEDKSEIGANIWFAEQSYNIATVRKSLLELVESDLTRFANMDKESSIEWLQKCLYTEPSTKINELTRDDLDKRSNKRFIEQVGNYSEISEFRIYTTIKGVYFLKEYARFKNEYWIRGLFLLFGVLLALGSAYIQTKYISK